MAFLTNEIMRPNPRGFAGLGDVTVSPTGAAFLASVAPQLARLRQMADEIGPAPLFMTAGYGAKWDPWFDNWQRLYDAGIAALPENGEARTTFIDEMRKLNNLSVKVRNGSASLALLTAMLTGNPLNVIKFTVGTTIVPDLIDAGKKTYDPGVSWLGWLWDHKWWVVGGFAALAVAPQAVGLALAVRRK